MQKEYIQGQINKIGKSVEDRQSRMAWQTEKEESKRKNTSRAKLKAASQEERIHVWKEHFKNLFGNSPKIKDRPIAKIINWKLGIKLCLFKKKSTLYEHKLKAEDLPPVMKYSQKYRRQGNSKTYCSNFVIPYITRTQQRERLYPTSPRKVTSESQRTKEAELLHP